MPDPIVQGDVVVIVATGLKQNQVDALEAVASGFETMKIPQSHVVQFRDEFLAAKPVPQIDDPTWNPAAHPPGTPVGQVDKYGLLKHFLHVMRDKFLTIRNQGKDVMANAAKTYDDDDIEV